MSRRYLTGARISIDGCTLAVNTHKTLIQPLNATNFNIETGGDIEVFNITEFTAFFGSFEFKVFARRVSYKNLLWVGVVIVYALVGVLLILWILFVFYDERIRRQFIMSRVKAKRMESLAENNTEELQNLETVVDALEKKNQ